MSSASSPSPDSPVPRIEQRYRDPFAAYDLAREELVRHPGHLYLRQVQAGALAQTSSPRAALEVLDQLYAEGHRDAETLGLLGSAWKQIGRSLPAGASRDEAWGRAFAYYAEGLSGAERAADFQGYYPGINAAFLSVLLQDEARARELAARAVALAEMAPTADYWVLATKAEAALLGRRLGEARDLYKSARPLASTFAQAAATRRQARQLLQALSLESGLVDDCFHVPPVLVFVGHLTDAPGRGQPRFPESTAGEVAARLEAAIARTGAAMGLAGAARGGDLLFLECLQKIKVETRIVLPLEEKPFRAVSVTGGDPKWETRFATVLAGAASVRIANSHSSTGDGAAFEYGTRILLGLARLEAQRLDTELRAIALWDGRPGDGHGGTAWAVSHLLAGKVPVENVFTGREGPITDGAAEPERQVERGRPIRALLFSDCKGYSKLREEQIADYTRAFLAGVARLIDHAKSAGFAPIVSNTWGDGLFLVFADVRTAAFFATALCAAVQRRAAELGLPEEVRLRIGLHAGPVTPFADPVTGRENFAGINVAYAARIEPIAPENQVCVSEGFAALAADAGLTEFRLDYLGVTPFHKDFGRYPLYQLRRADD